MVKRDTYVKQIGFLGENFQWIYGQHADIMDLEYLFLISEIKVDFNRIKDLKLVKWKVINHQNIF